MAVPTYDKFYPALIDFYSDGKEHSKRDAKAYCADYFNLTKEDQGTRLGSGKFVLTDRIGWGITYLTKAGLLEWVNKGVYRITTTGLKAYDSGSTCVTNEYLKQFSSYKQFVNPSLNEETVPEVAAIPEQKEQFQVETTPNEMLEKAMSLINKELSDELLEQVRNMDPFKFEELVVDLLVKMGYGRIDYSKTTRHTNDGGIDGLVAGDRFGFDVIYVQAKRWAAGQCVGRPEIQNFCGSMMPHGGTKGIFITTAVFSQGAIEYAESLHQTQKIILIDGKALTDLMIEYNVGVSVTKVYEIKRVDSDYFNEEN